MGIHKELLFAGLRHKYMGTRGTRAEMEMEAQRAQEIAEEVGIVVVVVVQECPNGEFTVKITK